MQKTDFEKNFVLLSSMISIEIIKMHLILQ